jgi:single-strand DNA-binding protein
MSEKKGKKRNVVVEGEQEDFSLNDLLLRGRISAAAIE